MSKKSKKRVVTIYAYYPENMVFSDKHILKIIGENKHLENHIEALPGVSMSFNFDPTYRGNVEFTAIGAGHWDPIYFVQHEFYVYVSSTTYQLKEIHAACGACPVDSIKYKIKRVDQFGDEND